MARSCLSAHVAAPQGIRLTTLSVGLRHRNGTQPPTSWGSARCSNRSPAIGTRDIMIMLFELFGVHY